MNWIDLLTQFDWQALVAAVLKWATILVGGFVAVREGPGWAAAATRKAKSAASVFKKAKSKAVADPEPNETVDAFAHLMKVRVATEHDKRARQCIRYLGALLAQPPETAK
jgi:hypothetical protein